MQKLLIFLVFSGLVPPASQGFTAIPDNPIAVANCIAKVKVDAARVRAAPSLDSPILGVRSQDEALYVAKVEGKWAQVVLPEGDSVYMAAYLLAFPANEILEQWKRETPSPSVGKKARVKLAQVNRWRPAKENGWRLFSPRHYQALDRPYRPRAVSPDPA